MVTDMYMHYIYIFVCTMHICLHICIAAYMYAGVYTFLCRYIFACLYRSRDFFFSPSYLTNPVSSYLYQEALSLYTFQPAVIRYLLDCRLLLRLYFSSNFSAPTIFADAGTTKDLKSSLMKLRLFFFLFDYRRKRRCNESGLKLCFGTFMTV